MNTQSIFGDQLQRIFLLYGNTQDEYISENGQILDLDELLHQHLKKIGYQKIIYYNHLGEFCLDQESRQGNTLQKQPLRARPPGGVRLLKKKQQSSNQPSQAKLFNPDGKLSIKMFSTIENSIKNTSIQTAIIFSDLHILDLKVQDELQTRFMGFLQNIRRLPAKNRNLVI
ncbi:MAG: hypothetical protein ACI86H_002115, partial [bacterium]